MANFSSIDKLGRSSVFRQAIATGVLQDPKTAPSTITPPLSRRTTRASSPPSWDNRALDLGGFRDRVLVRRDSVNSSNPVDIYKIRVPVDSYVTLSLTELATNLDVDLYDGTGSKLATLNSPGRRREYTSNGDDSVTPDGTYYIRVYRRTTQASNYKLTILSITV